MRLAEQPADFLALAEQLAGVGHWRWLPATGEVGWSDQVYAIYGVSRDAFAPHQSNALDVYHPEDRPQLAAAFNRCAATGEGFELTLRIRRLSDGAERVVAARAAAQRSAEGEVLAVYGVFQDVTDQQAAMRRLADSEAQHRLLAENVTDVIARYRPNGQFTYLSPSIERLIGYRPDELVGFSTFDFIHPDDHERVLSAFAAYAMAGPDAEPPLIPYRALHKQGRLVWVEAHPRALRRSDGTVREFLDTARDVTAQKLAEQEAYDEWRRAEAAAAASAESEARYRLLAEHSSDVILRIGLGGLITYCSPASRLLGYEPEEIVGRRTIDLVHPDDREHAIKLLGGVFSGAPVDPTVDRSYRTMLKDGSFVWMEGSPTIIRDADGQPIEVLSVYRDVTVRKALEAELTAARDQAQSAARAKADFLANMSHEFRTPLTSIIGFTGLLRDRVDLPDGVQRQLDHVAAASRSLLGLVNDVLDFSRLEAGQVTVEPEPHDAAAIVAEVCALHATEAEAKGLALCCEPDPAGALPLEVDGLRLRQVLHNLVGNAVKFTATGAVTVRCGLAFDARGRRLRVTVRDTGPGMSGAEQLRLFQRFSQADSSVTRRHGGSGLGLAISRQLARLMDGDIEVTSAPGQGACFTLDIAAPDTAPAQAVEERREADALPPMQLLVVDDHPVNRELVRLLLAGQPVEVTEAADGTEAVAACLARPFDVILMDLQMPGMDGVETLQAIRAGLGPNAATPVLALTAQTDPERVAELLAAGMAGHVAKPIDPAALLTAIAGALAAAGEDVAQLAA